MIIKDSQSERRRSPRIYRNVPLKIVDEHGDIVTETANLSGTGAYCQVNRYIDMMTKLKIDLLLPVTKGGAKESRKITCSGAVVRTEPIPGNTEQYNIAVFFTDISKRDAAFLEDFVGQDS